MSEIQNMYVQSQLALAAYSELTPGISRNNYIKALQRDGNGMSLTQAKRFADNWRVIHQDDGMMEKTYIDEFGQEHVYLDSTGFSGTLFQNTKTGEYALALRGTEPADFFNDIVFADFSGIVVQGWARDQIDSMNAWFERLITPVSEGGLGKLSGDEKLTVSGHSLGGHLATAFTLAWYDHIDHAYTYNGAGTGSDGSGAAYVQLLEILNLNPASPKPNDKITNLYAAPCGSTGRTRRYIINVSDRLLSLYGFRAAPWMSATGSINHP